MLWHTTEIQEDGLRFYVFAILPIFF